MKTILFTHKTPVGTFWIIPEPADRVRLGIDGTRLKSYSSAKAAARDVYRRTTGWEAWDTLADASAPESLTKWKRAGASKGRRHKAMEKASTDSPGSSEIEVSSQGVD